MKTLQTTDNLAPTSKPRFAPPKFYLFALLCCLFLADAGAAQLGTAFTYSGRLKYKNNPADGNFDLQVKLYDDANAGNLIATYSASALPIVNGLFVMNVDFSSVSMFNGTAYWLELSARPSGNNNVQYQTVSPRQPVNPTPYAFFAPLAATANTANSVASGQAVKSLNGLSDNVTLQAGANVTLTPSGNGLSIAASGGSSGWSLTGNAGTTPGVNFLGTTDGQPLEFKVNNSRGLRLENVGSFFTGFSVNLIAGRSINSVANGTIGATIAGGGFSDPNHGEDSPNVVGGNLGSIGGGAANSVGAQYGTVPGGFGNQANGIGSFAAGQLSRANHDGSFVWGDGSNAAFSTANGSWDALATGGANFHTGNNKFTVHGPWLVVNGYGNEQAYIGGDGNGNDVQVGSFNPAVTNISLYNASINQWMNLLASDTTVRTLTITGGSDLAEPFDLSDEDIPPGSVVIIDGDHPGQLVRSSQPYDTRVAGVVSGANGIHPGLMLHQDGINCSGKNVALTGRVYVLADAATGAINPGDLLTTSPTAGHAMKVTDHARAQGAVLGKAMSRLSQGKGMVLVLVTLQ